MLVSEDKEEKGKLVAWDGRGEAFLYETTRLNVHVI